MSRFADQLPIVTEPTPGNYLLGTDENDPKALVRIPAEGLGNGGGSTEYTILDETALDVDSNVALSAGLYLYVGNAPANFDLSGLEDGERVEIINHTAHKVYLFGFDNWVWNGITTALETDKGLIVEKGGLVATKYVENLLAFNALPSGLNQDWREGVIPPYLTFTYQFNNDTNDILYYLGTNRNTQPFSNPHGGAFLTVSASSVLSGYVPQNVTNRIFNDFYHSNQGGQGNAILTFTFLSEISIRPTRFYFVNRQWNMTPMRIEGKYLSQWQILGNNINGSDAYSVTVNASEFYNAFRFTKLATSDGDMSEIMIYGDLII